MVAVAAAALGAGVTAAWLRHTPDGSSGLADLPATGTDQAASVPNNIPPWGELHKVPMLTEKPDEFIHEPALTAAPVRWHFAGLSPDGTRQVLLYHGLCAADAAVLMQPDRCEGKEGSTTLTVPDELVFRLGTAQRQKLYPLLGRNTRNEYQQYPFTFLKDRTAGILAPHLQPETLALVLDRMYRIGNSDCFADLGPVLRRIPDPHQRVRLIKCLTRQETLLLKVQIREDSDIDSLVSWWAKGSRRKDLRSLLQSLATIPGGAIIDVAHLMPGFPRLRLYTYPGPAPDGQQGFDCHYSCLNFFRSEPDDAFLDPEKAAAAILTDYEKVTGPQEFGDLILLTGDGQNIIHSCVHVAEDVVFTKNGLNQMQPWVLMTLEQVEAAYPSDKPWDRLFYRLKQPPP